MSDRDSNPPRSRSEGGITWRIAATALAGIAVSLGGWSMSKQAAEMEDIRREFRTEIEQFKRDRLSDLSRLSSMEAKLDNLREGQMRQEAKIDALLAAGQPAKGVRR